MSSGYKGYLETQEHNKKYPKINSVDPKERYDRVYGFMRRDSKQHAVERNIRWYEEFIKRGGKYVEENKGRFLNYIEELKGELDEAKKTRLAMTLQTLIDMEQGIINNTTQGIWLSYPHTLEVVKTDENKDRHVIVHLCTGEKFKGIRKWDAECRQPRYSKVKLLEKI